ncbi:MAG: branched-chain amino acid ABC transporter permease [Candidatus Eremiobacteraeota bacterium]|nr:branched-chain amino acid ABC transporter permease [Candidatus Eremiobacteraeota bacterium]MBV8353769.1 branched-chain amino acid ABC transporter permease [Candidatus Eremiobacteraeota bacterium]
MIGETAALETIRPKVRSRGLDWIAEIRFLFFTALGLAIFPFVLHPIGGYAGLATQILMVGIAATGFNLLLGYAGVLSYGHAMFYGIGGYAAALMILKIMPGHANLWLTILFAVAAVSLQALIIGALVIRTYGIYFALITLAFAQMFFFITFQWRDLTNGDNGLNNVVAPAVTFGPLGSFDLTAALPALPLGPFGDLSDLHVWYVFSACAILLVLWFMRFVVASQFGETLDAIRENEERSTFVGFNPALYKLAAFVISGGLAGLAGALRAMYDGSVAVDTLTIDQSGSFVVYTIIGGVQTLFGPLVGTAVVMYLANVISAKTEAWRLIEGLLFVLVIVFLPHGILGSFRKGGRFNFARILRLKR